MRILAHLWRYIATALLLLQLSLPYAQAQAAANGMDLASLLCNPSGQSVSSEAEAALIALLDVITEEEEADIPPDCDRCVTAHVALPVPTISLLDRPHFARLAHDRPVSESHSPASPRGPPCGTRAPPHFV